MEPAAYRIIFAIFLLLHGWIHMSLATVPLPKPGALRTPFLAAWWREAIDPLWPISRSRLSPAAVRTIGWVLWMLTVIGFTAAALILIFVPSWTAAWQGLTVISSLISIVMIGLYWHPWLPVGILIDVILAASIFLRWPFLQFN